MIKACVLLICMLTLLSTNAKGGDAPPRTDDDFAAAFRCPEDLSGDADRATDLQKLLQWAKVHHPDWSTDRTIEWRVKLLESHECETTFASYRRMRDVATPPDGPLPTGRYEFQHRFGEAEHWRIPSIKLIADIDGDHIVLTNADSDEAFPFGIVDEGTLMWNVPSGHWIIGDSDADRTNETVGPCSDGPEFIDLELRLYWTC